MFIFKIICSLAKPAVELHAAGQEDAHPVPPGAESTTANLITGG